MKVSKRDEYLGSARDLFGFALVSGTRTAGSYNEGLREARRIVTERLAERAAKQPVCNAKLDIYLGAKPPVRVTLALSMKIADPDWPTWEVSLKGVPSVGSVAYDSDAATITLLLTAFYRSRKEVTRAVSDIAKVARVKTTTPTYHEDD